MSIMKQRKLKKITPFSKRILIVVVICIGFVQSMAFQVTGTEIIVSPKKSSDSESSKEIILNPFVKEGNIYIALDGQTRQLTHSGVDYAPLVSPDGTFIIFTRQIEVLIEDDYGEIYKGEQLWAIDVTGQNERLVLGKMPGDSTWDKGIVFQDLMFSPDGKLVYFSVVAGNSHALHVVNIDDSRYYPLMYGVGFDVIQKVVGRDDLRKYKGFIITCEKRYSIDGSYYMMYLYSPEGTTENSVVKGDCSGGYQWFEIMPHSNPRREPVIPR